jgi:ribosomal protein S6
MGKINTLNETQTIYEIGYLLLPSISEDKLSSVTGVLREIIAQAGGVEIAAEEPFKEDLAYSMSKTIGASKYVVKDAYLGWIKFEVERAKINVIKAGVEKMDEVLRFLLVKTSRATNFTFAQAREMDNMTPTEEGEVPLLESDPVLSSENMVN